MYTKDFDVQKAFNEVGAASSRSKALKIFEKHKNLLKDWRIIYSDNTDAGPFKLRQCQFSSQGFVSTVFSGKTLWILDHDVISTDKTLAFRIGYGTCIDSNVASFIRSLAYREHPKENLLNFCQELSDYFSFEELSRINPYLYLWEVQRDRSLNSISKIRETIAAIFALQYIKSPLNTIWGCIFRESYREKMEIEADQFLFEFYRHLDTGVGKEIELQTDILEAMLVRTKIIELSSKKSMQNKMKELIQFMHNDLSTLMVRELIICADIIFHEGRYRLSQKLHGLQNQKEPLLHLRNCARDLNMVRMMDSLSNSSYDSINSAFYVSNIITFDRDISDILRLSGLRAIALHRTSSLAFPIINEPIPEWLAEKIGEEGITKLQELSTKDNFDLRARRRSRHHISSVLEQDKLRLLSLIREKKTNV